ncbi:DUF1425 domain-containing protein [Acerihabitans sp. TG2]|uniref:YcfL family protein n=1 Tax=Acerihabitans sp. TG2 TaxID=3096008 RepID=UPI002B23082C|nr:DUF1425 domain-containing protein [Acerihabitans sp. TG2]MEA9391997.1 DUF1425 domain-containing protein [Acerihabitans sp. TG2]
MSATLRLNITGSGRTLRFVLPLLTVLLTLAGCGQNPKDTLMINDRQTLIMDPSVMTAGISVGKPEMSDDKGRLRAQSVIHNRQHHAVTIHYRFYWYDEQGLDILPFADVRTVTVPAGADVSLDSVNGNLEAKRVRLSLFL